MKRVVALLTLCAVLVGCFVGCGKPANDPSTPTSSDISDVSTSTTTTTTEGDVTGDTTTGTGDQTTDASDGTTTEGEQTAGTSGTSGTAGTQGTTGTKKPSTSDTKDTTSGTKDTTTKISTTKNTTTTTTKSRVTGMFSSTTTSSGGGITVPTQNGGNKGYEFDPGDEWELFWSDEFNGTELDTTKWNCEDGKGNGFTKKVSNIKVQNGQLVITARHENPKDNKGLAFSTGYVTTARKFSFQYGRLEFRARLPYGEGVWPALWTMGDYYLTTSDEKGWPRCGEIDIMEAIGSGSEAEKYTERANRKSTCNLHWGENRDVHRELGGIENFVQDGILADAYHIFAVEWDEDYIRIFFDDRMLTEVSLDDPSMLDSFHQKHWIIMNIATCTFEPDIANETTPLPQSMFVDYVRVYKKK